MTVPSRKPKKVLTCSRCSSRRLPTWILCAIGSHLFLSLVLVSVLHYSYHVPFSIPLLTTLQKQQKQKQQKQQQQKQKWKSTEQELGEKLNATIVQPCTPNTHNSNSCNLLLEQSPDTANAVLVLYNPLHQERILCDGTRIGPRGILLRNQELHCTEPPRLFPTEPTLENHGRLEPIQLYFYGNYTPIFEEFPCDVPCWSAPPMSKRVTLRRMVLDTPFRIVHSMEGPAYYKRLRIQKRAHLQNMFYSTTSFESEIPLPYFSWEEYGNRMLRAEPVEFDNAIKGAVFMASNCASRNKRELIVESLINMTQEMNDDDIQFRVDSVSDCLHNAEKPKGTNNDKIQILQHYLFYLAFENQCETDYITEKLWSTFVAGVIPVYFGAPNIQEHVPPHSIINVHDFNTTEALMAYLIQVANNKTLYESYHAWRKQPFPLKLAEKYNFTHTHSVCRTCRWAFAKKYGLGWDHSTQTVQELKIPRKLCTNEKGLLTYPVRESWSTAISLDESEAILSANSTSGHRRRKVSKCDSKGNQPKSLIIPFYDNDRKEHHFLQRTVINQDGAIDMFLGPVNGSDSNERIIGESIRLRLATDIQGDKQLLKTMSELFIQFQDSNNRMTILSNRNMQWVNVMKMADGVVELKLFNRGPEEEAYGASWPIYIRIIMEDVDTFYEDGQAFTSFYGRAMAEDFFNPLQRYVVQRSLIGVKDRNIWSNIRLGSARLVEGAASEKEFIYPDASKTVNVRNIEASRAK